MPSKRLTSRNVLFAAAAIETPAIVGSLYFAATVIGENPRAATIGALAATWVIGPIAAGVSYRSAADPDGRGFSEAEQIAKRFGMLSIAVSICLYLLLRAALA